MYLYWLKPCEPRPAAVGGSTGTFELRLVKKLGVIHRGFSNAQETKFRNSMWNIAIELKTIFPQLPVIGDPSHPDGWQACVILYEIAQRLTCTS